MNARFTFKTIILTLPVLLVFGCDTSTPLRTEMSTNAPKTPTPSTTTTKKADRLSKLESQNEELIQMLEEAESKLFANEDELEKAQMEIVAANKLTTELREKLERTNSDLQKTKQVVAKLKEAFDTLSKTASTQFNELDELGEPIPEVPKSDPTSDSDNEPADSQKE